MNASSETHSDSSGSLLAGARDDVPALLAGLDLFVLPSLAEGISNTVLEAMASGLPAIATRVGGNAELVADGSTGTPVASDDADAMADAIAGYALDRNRARQHGENARALAVSRFSIDTTIARYADLRDTLLASRCRPMIQASSAAGIVGGSPGSQHSHHPRGAGGSREFTTRP